MATKKAKKEVKEKTIQKCLCCGEEKPLEEGFYISNSYLNSNNYGEIKKRTKSNNKIEFLQGRMPYCKNCLENTYNKFLEKYKSIEIAIFYTCASFNIYYSQKLVDTSIESAKDTDKKAILEYMKNIAMVNYVGMDFFDSEDLNLKDKSKSITNKNTESQIINNEEYMKKMIPIWGKGYSPEEYKFLEDYYDELAHKYDDSMPIQINNYKNMAKAQLQGNKCLENNDITGYQKAMNILSMLSTDSNIKPSQKSKTAETIEKGAWGVFINRIEDKEPIYDWEKDLGKINYLKFYIKTFFFGNLAKALNIRNPWQKEFDEEMKKHTVELSEIEDDDVQDFLGGNENG